LNKYRVLHLIVFGPRGVTVGSRSFHLNSCLPSCLSLSLRTPLFLPAFFPPTPRSSHIPPPVSFAADSVFSRCHPRHPHLSSPSRGCCQHTHTHTYITIFAPASLPQTVSCRVAILAIPISASPSRGCCQQHTHIHIRTQTLRSSPPASLPQTVSCRVAILAIPISVAPVGAAVNIHTKMSTRKVD
jgi:hypothetical protein